MGLRCLSVCSSIQTEAEMQRLRQARIPPLAMPVQSYDISLHGMSQGVLEPASEQTRTKF